MKFQFFKWLLLSLSSILLVSIFNKLTNFNDLFNDFLSIQLTTQQIEQYFKIQKKWEWFAYVFVSVMILIKISLITTLIYIGTFFFSKVTVTFKKLWSIVITTEFVFLLVPIYKSIWFYFFQTDYTLEDIHYFYPLSAINIVGYEGLEPWLIYPFQVLNLFELGYCLILAYSIGKATETTMDNGLKIVMSSYGSALLLWVVVVMFFTLNYS